LQPGWKRQRNRLARHRGTGSIAELIGKPGFPGAIGVGRRDDGASLSQARRRAPLDDPAVEINELRID
jgi:hypothetical protein